MEKGKLIGKGRTAEVFENGEDRITKLFREGIPKFVVENEFKASSAIYNQTKLTPKVFEFVEVNNRYGIVYEKINGLTMMEMLASKPWKLKKLAQELAKLHKEIQQKVEYKLPKLKERLKENISNVELLEVYEKEKLYKYIDELEDSNILCHGDLHPDNIIISEKESVIIDWMTATEENPLADAARTSIMLKFGDIPEKTIIEKKIINFIRKRFYSEYIKQYLSLTGSKLTEIEKWELPVAAARLTEWLPVEEKSELLNFVHNILRKE